MKKRTYFQTSLRTNTITSLKNVSYYSGTSIITIHGQSQLSHQRSRKPQNPTSKRKQPSNTVQHLPPPHQHIELLIPNLRLDLSNRHNLSVRRSHNKYRPRHNPQRQETSSPIEYSRVRPSKPRVTFTMRRDRPAKVGKCASCDSGNGGVLDLSAIVEGIPLPG